MKVHIVVGYRRESSYNGDQIDSIEEVFTDKASAEARRDEENEGAADQLSGTGAPLYYDIIEREVIVSEL
jgi:hypothetical protein